MALTALGGGQTYAQYIAGLAPLIWLRFNEISGTTVLNWGTGGSTFDGVWTPGSGAQGQHVRRIEKGVLTLTHWVKEAK